MTTPIIIAALARRPRRNPRAVRSPRGEGGGERGPHNYLAEAPKKQPGAPLGNRNAARRLPEQVDRLARMDALVRTLSATADAAIAAVAQACAERALLAALLRAPK
jgi:hypothetical protein